jgi:2-methylisocitrate lyase-like PEP mutase family enzyme
MKDHSLSKKAEVFKALHERPGLLVLPNPWDAGSAKLLAAMGYEALATTSAGLAWMLGKPDGAAAVTREESMRNAREIVGATGLPVAADLENGYGDDPEDCGTTILQAAEAGLVGGSIEDATGKPGDPIYSFQLAVERVRAAVKAARSLPFPFILAARAENLINGRPDLADTIRRLEAFAAAGADVLYAPGLKTKEEVSAVVKAVAPKPVNVLVGTAVLRLPLEELAELGVKRVSLGSALARVAYGAMIQAAEGMRRKGDLSFVGNAATYATINDMLKKSYP